MPDLHFHDYARLLKGLAHPIWHWIPERRNRVHMPWGKTGSVIQSEISALISC